MNASTTASGGDQSLSVLELLESLLLIQLQKKEKDYSFVKSRSRFKPDADETRLANERISHLQKLIQQQISEKTYKEKILQRCQISNHLWYEILNSNDSENKKEIRSLIDTRDKLVLTLLQKKEEIDVLQENHDEIQRMNYDIQIRNRKLMDRVQAGKDDDDNNSLFLTSVKAKSLQDNLSKLRDMIKLDQHVFQGLIVASRPGPPDAEEMMNLIVSLGQTPDI